MPEESEAGVFRKYYRKHGFMFGVAILFLTIEAAADLLQPTIMAHIIDEGVAEGRMDYVVKMGAFMLLITALGAIGASVRNIVSSRVSGQFGAELRADLFRHIQKLGFAKLDRFERASLIVRMTNDVTQVQNFANGLMRIFVKAPLLCIGSLIMAVRLNPELSLVLVVVVPLAGLFVAMNLRIGVPYFTRMQKALDRVNGIIREYLAGVRVVKAFHRYDAETLKFDGANGEYRDRATDAARIVAFFSPTVMLTMNMGIVAVLWFGGHRVSGGGMQVGHIVAFINYMTQMLYAFMVVTMVFTMFVRAKGSAARIGEVLAERNDMAWVDGAVSAARASERGMVEFDAVTCRYGKADSAPALRDVSFVCRPGETIGIIGSTGSGKSTLVGLIPRYYEADSGTVKVNGIDVRLCDPKELRRRIAVVPQKTMLFTGTVADNIRWGNEEATREQVEQAARMAEAHEFISKLPEGYDAPVGQGGTGFSGGQKQRLAIARALVRQPDILILDDCTSAVDAATEARIKSALRTYAKGLTCILIAQRITSVIDADRIVVLDQGELAGIGSHAELMDSCRVYREIYESQLGKEGNSHAASV
ncbi:ABC transporter ATP-binding protein [Paenibacillus chartarius]|uniref:ABC transporter ATP-binding protein n=1 Tax=Paenibacillus chartarius TaxID=747481 RepID=A0ABV6DT99_9BACL